MGRYLRLAIPKKKSDVVHLRPENRHMRRGEWRFVDFSPQRGTGYLDDLLPRRDSGIGSHGARLPD
jgi:hypothetical protein